VTAYGSLVLLPVVFHAALAGAAAVPPGRQCRAVCDGSPVAKRVLCLEIK